MSAAKPKSAKPGNRPPVLVEDPAALLPVDVQQLTEAPFPVTWQPAVYAVHASDGINLSTIKDAFKQLHVVSHITLSDLAARLDPADPLCAELASAAVEGQQHAAVAEGGSLPVSAAAKLLQRQFAKEEVLAWKFEVVRRRDQLAKAEAEAQAAQEALADAEAAKEAASGRLQVVKARLPQPAPAPVTPPTQQEPASIDTAAAGADAEDEQDSEQQGTLVGAGATAVPPLNLQQLQVQEVTLTPEQRRSLNEATAGLEVAEAQHKLAQEAATAAGAGLAAAEGGLNSPFVHYEPYWCEGLPSSAAGLSAAVSAGIPLRAVVWMHPSSTIATPDASAARGASAAGGSTRPASAASLRLSTGGGAPAAVVYSLPGELQQLQGAMQAASWDAQLSSLLVLELPVEDATSPFTRVPAGGSITDPAWAVASSAAAAAKAAAVAASAAALAANAPAADTKQAPATGGKPGSAAPSIKASRPGSSVTGGTAAASATASAAAALPEEVVGCKELARALLTVTEQAKRFDCWRQSGVHVYRMPLPAAASMGYYRHLLDSVPPERHSVPLVLHAMLEQVRQNCMLESSPEALAGADQAILAAEIDSAISSAFSSLVDEQTCLVQEQSQGSDGLTLLSHADCLARAACGLSTGNVHGQQQQETSGQAAAAAAADGPEWGFAAHGLSSIDVDTVEQHMLQLLQLPGVPMLTGADPGNDTEAALERQLQQAELKSVCQDVPYGTVQRSQLLDAAVKMLPPEVQAAHAADIQGRYHKELLQPHVLRQVLQHCSMELPDAADMPYQPTGDHLVALYAGPQLDRAYSCSMPHAMTFSQYWGKLLQGSCKAPELQSQVYEMGEAAAQQQWQQRLLYTDAGSIARIGTDTLLAVTKGPTLVRLVQPDEADQPFQVVATLDHGSVVATSIVAAAPVSCPSTASLSHSSTMKEGPRASDSGSIGALAAVPPSPNSSSSSTGKKRPGSGNKATLGSAQPALSSVPEFCAPEASEDPEAATGTGLGAMGKGRSVPPWSALCVSTPQGLRVQLSTDGCVLLEPVGAPNAQVMQATGVDVLGAPLAAGKLRAAAAASVSQWHAVLPDSTLIKASPAANSAAGATAAHTVAGLTGECVAAGGAPCRATTVLHTDGSISQHHALELPLAGVDGELRQEVAGWLRTGPDGQQTWVVDTIALQDLRASLAKAAEEAAVAAAAMAAEAAAAAAAAETTGKKGGKGEKKGLKHTVSSKQPTKQQQQDQAGPAADAAAGGGSISTTTESVHAQAAAAAEAALHELEHQAPQCMGSLRAVQLTDADTRAVVTTREDHLLIVDYPDGSRLLQDAEGCRLSHVQGTWLFEAAGLPAVKGGELGVELQPCPGVHLSWDAASSCVTLLHMSTGTVISLSPTGHVVYSPAGQPVEPFLDGCIDLVQQDQQHNMQQELGDGVLEEHHSDSIGEPHHQQQQQQPSQHARLEAAQEQQEPGEAQGCAQDQQTGTFGQQLTLPSLCSELDCQGLVGFDLMTGETALYEAETCRIHIGPGGCILVWDNGEAEVAAGADADSTSSEQCAAAESEAMPESAQMQAIPAAAANSAEDEEGLTDEEIATKRAAAAAAAQAAAVAAAAEQAAAEAAAAAARAKPKPIAPAIKPRLFVIQPATGSGYEVLAAGVVEQHAAWVSTQPGYQHLQQEVLGADEPGTTCHTFLERHAHKSSALQPLEVAAPTLALPVYVDPEQSLVSLRRAGTVVQAEWQSGQSLKLPRIAALNPWHLARAAEAGTVSDASVGTAAGANGSYPGDVVQEPRGYEGTAATRIPGSSPGVSAAEGPAGQSGQVVVVREVLELPVLDPETQDKVAAAVETWRTHKAEQQLMLELRSPSPAPCSQQQQADADSVSALLEAAGFAALPPDGLVTVDTGVDATAGASVAGEAQHNNSKPRDRSAASSSASKGAATAGSTGQGRLQEVKGMLLEQQQLAAAAEAKAKADAAARAAAEAAAKKKPYKPWVKQPGPYDHTPKRPEPGQTLKYFNTQEGMQALTQDPLLASGTHITKAGLPPPKPVQPASAGIQQVPGVYLASSTALCDQDCQAGAAGRGGSEGVAAAAGHIRQASQPAQITSPSSTMGSGRAGAGSSSPQHAPLMHAGRPTRLGSPVAQSLVQLQQQQQQQQQQQVSEGVNDQLGISSSSSSGGKGPVLDVYGQPRVVSPSLPATYSKAHAAGSLNAEYLAREGAALRTVKNSSTNLVRASGKDGQQIVLRPGHLHFGSIPQGAVVHRAAKLLNGSADVVRFTIMRPELPLRVLHKPAPLPPGLEATFTVELVAESPGDFVGEVVVKTELKVFSLSVSAKVLPAASTEAVLSGGLVPAGLDPHSSAEQL